MKNFSIDTQIPQIQDSQHFNKVLPVITNDKRKRRELIWTIEQDKIYIEFLKSKKQLFRTETKRRVNKVFDKISKQLQNHTSTQCRTHHKKMLHSYKHIQGIIRHLQSKINQKRIQQTKSDIGILNSESDQLLKENIEQRYQKSYLSIYRQQQQRQFWKILDSEIWQKYISDKQISKQGSKDEILI